MGRIVSGSVFRGLLVLAACAVAALAVAFCMTQPAPAEAFADDPADYEAAQVDLQPQTDGHVHDGVTFTKWDADNALPNAAGSYYLDKDVTIGGLWQVPGDVKLCLNGHYITLAPDQYTEIIYVPVGSSLEIYDCTTSGQIKGNGTCSGIEADGNIAMHGGTLTGTYTGINLNGLGADQQVTFNMTGGTITNILNGWGVHIYGPYATFNMTGGSIIGNPCHYGVLNEAGTMNVSGSVTIANNKHYEHGDGTNVHLYHNPKTGENNVINVAGELTNTTPIGVSADAQPTPGNPLVITSGYKAKMGDVDPIKYFVADDPDYTVTWSRDGNEAALVKARTIKFDANGGTGDMDNQKVIPNTPNALNPNTFTYEGHEFKNWNTKPDGTGQTYQDKQVVTILDDLQLYAWWADTYPITVREPIHGTVTPSRAAAGKGDEVKLTIAPDDGFMLDELFVTGPDGAVKVTNDAFSMPQGSVTIAATFKKKPLPVPSKVMYRLYNPNSGEHFYTSSASERESLAKAGWRYEGEAWKAPESSVIPVYRLYNSHVPMGDHHYTVSVDEYSSLIAAGWTGEGIGWYSAESKSVPLYRLYNPYAVTGTHHYTSSIKERDDLVHAGWRDEGIGWYGEA